MKIIINVDSGAVCWQISAFWEGAVTVTPDLAPASAQNSLKTSQFSQNTVPWIWIYKALKDLVAPPP